MNEGGDATQEDALCFRPLEGTHANLGAPLKLYKISAIINSKAYYTNRLLSVRVIFQSAVNLMCYIRV